MKYNTPFVAYDGSLFPVQSTTTPHTMDGWIEEGTNEEGRKVFHDQGIHSLEGGDMT